MAGVKNIWRVIFITALSYFTSSETANTQKSEVFLLRISSGNVNASVVTCWYLQIYYKSPLETVHCFRLL